MHWEGSRGLGAAAVNATKVNAATMADLKNCRVASYEDDGSGSKSDGNLEERSGWRNTMRTAGLL